MSFNPTAYFRDRFARQGELYVTRAGAGRPFYEAQAAAFLEHVPSPRGRRVLDYGCGVGRLEPELGSGQAYIGIDVVPGALALARERGRPGSIFARADADVHCDCDLGVAITVFQHIPDHQIEEVLGDFSLRLVIGATVVIIDTNERSTAPHVFRRSPSYFVATLGIEDAHAYVIDVDKPHSHWVLTGRI